MDVSDFPREVLAMLRGRSSSGRPSDADPDHAARIERQERAVRWALRLRDPRRLCRLGWHRTASGMWFRIGTAVNPSKLIVYRVGSEPFDRACTTSGTTLASR